MNKTQMPPEDVILQSIKSAITQSIEDAIDKEMDEVKKRVEKSVRSQVGAIAANLSRHISYATFDNELTIKVKFDKD